MAANFNVSGPVKPHDIAVLCINKARVGPFLYLVARYGVITNRMQSHYILFVTRLQHIIAPLALPTYVQKVANIQFAHPGPIDDPKDAKIEWPPRAPEKKQFVQGSLARARPSRE